MTNKNYIPKLRKLSKENKKHIYKLYDPQYKRVLVELRAHYFWFHFFSFFFPRRDKEFYKYILRRNRKS